MEVLEPGSPGSPPLLVSLVTAVTGTKALECENVSECEPGRVIGLQGMKFSRIMSYVVGIDIQEL